MALFRRKTDSANISIRLTPRANDDHFYTSADHYLSNEIVTGYAILSPGSSFTRSKITLKGSIQTMTDDTHTGAMGKGWRSEQLPFLGVLYNDKGRKAVKGEDGSLRIPFKFDLSKCERLVSFTSDLPPSLDSRLEGHKASECQFEISYSLNATAFSAKSTLASTTQKIFILPVSPDALGAEHSEAPNEYHWAQTHSLTKQPRLYRLNSSGSTGPTGSRIEVAGQEPECIVFNPEDAIPEGTTELPFVVKFSPRDNDDTPLPSRCQVKAHLITKTHITPDGLKQIGSKLEFMRTGGNHVTKERAGFEQESSVSISRWKSCESATTEPFSVARFSFLYNIRHEKPPMPTFFTPLLSRRYFLDLTLSFPERPSEIFKLTLPVEVAHGTLDGASDDEGKKSRESSPGMEEARL